MTNKEQMDAAKAFATESIFDLCVDLKQWHDTALLSDGKLRELAAMLPSVISDHLHIAQGLVEYAAIEQVIRLRNRVAELEEALEEIGFRTDHGNELNRINCPICKIVDRVIR